MSRITSESIVGEPEVVERHPEQAVRPHRESDVTADPAWLSLKAAVTAIRAYQMQDGSIPDTAHHPESRGLVETICQQLLHFVQVFPHDAEYLEASVADFERWAASGFGEPDFYDSLVAFHPQRDRVNGLQHLVVFPMYTQNGSSDRLVEAVLIEVIWPEFVAALEAGEYSN